MRQADEVYYLHEDNLGSTSLTTDDLGEVVSEVRYHPYGLERWTAGESPTDFGFTSQRNEKSFGLMDYNARYYSPVLGRFVSPDTIVPEPTSSGGFNRYRYVRNNPIKYTDPTGHKADPACGCGGGKKLEDEETVGDRLVKLITFWPRVLRGDFHPNNMEGSPYYTPPPPTPTPPAITPTPTLQPTITPTPNAWAGREFIDPPNQRTLDQLSCDDPRCASPSLLETGAGIIGFGVGFVPGLLPLPPLPPMPDGGTPEAGRPYVGENPGYYFDAGMQVGGLTGGALTGADALDAGSIAVDLVTGGNTSNSASVVRYTKGENGEFYMWCDYCKNETLIERPPGLK